MLLERANAVAARINAYQKLKSTADEADKFATRARQFDQISVLLAALRETLEELERVGVTVDFTPLDGVGFADKARLLRLELGDDPARIDNPPFDLKYAFSDRLTGIAGAGAKAAQAGWKAYVDGRAPVGSDDVLSALAQIQQFRASVVRIRQIRSEIAGVGASLPSDPTAAIARLDTLIADHDTAWQTLEASDIPASVVGFIRAAATGDAMLSAFTPEVRSWLEGRGLISAFRITLK